MNDKLAKAGDVSIAAAVVAAIGLYANQVGASDIRIVYCLTGLGIAWMLCRTAIKIAEILKGK